MEGNLDLIRILNEIGYSTPSLLLHVEVSVLKFLGVWKVKNTEPYVDGTTIFRFDLTASSCLGVSVGYQSC